MRCVNEKCAKDPLNALGAVVVTIDSDMACSQACKVEYEKQRDHFLNVVLPDDEKYNQWLNAPVLRRK